MKEKLLLPAIGDVVMIRAVDWGHVPEETSSRSEFTIVRGTIYGQVLVCNEEQITVAFQVFDTGNVRNTLSIPLVTIERIEILGGADSHE